MGVWYAKNYFHNLVNTDNMILKSIDVYGNEFDIQNLELNMSRVKVGENKNKKLNLDL
jgi:hypothetical protein